MRGGGEMFDRARRLKTIVRQRRHTMTHSRSRRYAAWASSVALAMLCACSAVSAQGPLPAPAVDIPAASVKGPQTAVFAGGCFWGVEAVFRHTKGVQSAVSGYAGGAKKDAQYETVSSGRTGHAESVQVTYDPSKVTYGQLLQIFFSVAHDPTERNRQGPDVGPQYRSAIFYVNDDQKRVADAYVEQLARAKVFPKSIATEVTRLPEFYPAEDYHQDYLAKHPTNPYIVFNDLPKLAELQKQFPAVYTK
jgi:peptide-methionine (S)-S-oxide reductase